MREDIEQKRLDTEKKYKLTVKKAISYETLNKRINATLSKVKEARHIEHWSEMALILEVTPVALSRIRKGHQEPSLPLIVNMNRKFGCSIDEFLLEKEKGEDIITDPNPLPTEVYKKYVALYQLYYFANGSIKQRGNHASALRSGILFVDEERTTGKYKVTAIFDMSKEGADALFRDTFMNGKDTLESTRNRMDIMGRSNHIYVGEMSLSTSNIFISLRYKTLDVAQIILHRPDVDPDKNYIGGLGAMVSVESGRESCPCMQCIGITRFSLDASAEEVADHLLMRYPGIDVNDSLTKKVVDDFKMLYIGEDKLQFSEELKMKTLASSFDDVIQQAVEKKTRVSRISPVADDEFFHYIKRVGRKGR